MPLSDLHKRKFWKNIAVLAAIGVFGLLVWAITVIRISQGISAAG